MDGTFSITSCLGHCLTSPDLPIKLFKLYLNLTCFSASHQWWGWTKSFPPHKDWSGKNENLRESIFFSFKMRTWVPRENVQPWSLDHQLWEGRDLSAQRTHTTVSVPPLASWVTCANNLLSLTLSFHICKTVIRTAGTTQSLEKCYGKLNETTTKICWHTA